MEQDQSKTQSAVDVRSSGLLAAAKLIESVGACISMYLPGGDRSLSPENLVEVLRDQDGWLAKQYNITPERFREWRIYMANQQCTGTTRKGHQCLNRGAHYPEPNRFVPGESDRCNLHVDVSR